MNLLSCAPRRSLRALYVVLKSTRRWRLTKQVNLHVSRGGNAACCIGLTFCLLTGCQQQEPIRAYHVAKRAQAPRPNHPGATVPQGQPGRMLAAMIPHDEKTWFFKVLGPDKPVADIDQAFRQLVGSVRFKTQAGEPTWTLPKGWEQKPASAIRFATLEVPTGDKTPPLEVTVIPLTTGQGDVREYQLANINRWRGQLSLAPITLDQLDDESETIKAGDVQAVVVNLHGVAGAIDRMQVRASSSPSSPTAQADAIRYEAPEQWQKLPSGGMRKAAFRVGEKDQQAEVTVIDLAVAAGDLLPNVNRWRGQVKLEPVSQKELEATLEPIEGTGWRGHFVELQAPEGSEPRETILGVITMAAGRAWFVKLQAGHQLAEQEKERFLNFARSLQFGQGSVEKRGP